MGFGRVMRGHFCVVVEGYPGVVHGRECSVWEDQAVG